MRLAEPLLFTDYLKKVPSSFIFEHLLGDRGPKRRIVSPSLLEELKESFCEKERLQKRFEELSDDAKILCARAYLFGHRGVEAPESRFLQDELVRSFLVYVAQDDKENSYLVGFDDLAQSLLPLFIPVLFKETKEISSSSHPAVPYQCLNDCIVFMSLAARKQVKLTQHGKLVRSSVLTLQKLLQGISPATTPDRNEKSRKLILNLLLAYLLHESLVVHEGKLLVPDFDRLWLWMNKNMSERLRGFFEFALQESGNWRYEIFDYTAREYGEKWFGMHDFDEDKDTAEQLFRVLHYFGYLEAGKSAKGNHLVWRRNPSWSLSETEEKQIAVSVIIMPDFSAVLPPEATPGVLFTFSSFGVFTVFDQVYKGSIDKEVLNNSLSRGVDPQEILECLTSWHAPENVLVTVREWIREFSRLFITDRTLIISNDTNTTKQLHAYEPLRNYIEPIQSDAVFTVKPGAERKVREILEFIGFDTRYSQQREKKTESSREEKSREYSLFPVFEPEKPTEQNIRPMSVGKYSTDLKALELNELFHVIDYAILMGYQLRFEYEGSSYIPRGEYTVVPRNLHKGMDPAVDARQVGTEKEKRFDVRKIQRIGVHPV